MTGKIKINIISTVVRKKNRRIRVVILICFYFVYYHNIQTTITSGPRRPRTLFTSSTLFWVYKDDAQTCAVI